jgi:2-C-methyl-D-erythritol 2,4-cyclodiphosphate synthase
VTVRVGQGFDVHPVSAQRGRPLVLGGVHIPEAAGLQGHSDADVVLHALTDALLGAAGLGDLGSMFGTDEPAWKDADSTRLLAAALDRIRAAGWSVVNADCTVVAERPRLGPQRDAIAGSLARQLGVEPGAVGVKVTSTDGLGFTGRGEGIACLAVVLLEGSDAERA